MVMMSMPLLICYFISVPPWPGEAKANLTMGSGSDSDLGVAAEPNALAVAAAVAPAVERKGGKKVKDDQRDEKQLCWLCNVEIQGTPVTYRGRMVDGVCKNAIRCHYNTIKGLGSEFIEADSNMLNESPDDWKDGVLLLAKPDGRSRGTVDRENHKAWYSQAFTEFSYSKKGVLLRKPRFIAFMKHWENYNETSASESFDRRLDDASSNHTDSEGEARVRVRGNDEVNVTTGRRYTPPSTRRRSSGSGAACNSRRRASANESDARRRRRGSGSCDASASARDRRRSRSRGRDRHQSERRRGVPDPASPAPTQNSKSTRPPLRSTSPQATRQRQMHLPSRFGRGGSGGRSGSGRGAKVARKVDGGTIPDTDNETFTPENPAIQFLARKTAMKTSLNEEIRKFKLKTFIGTTLQKLVNELSPGDLNTLKKQGDASGVCKSLDKLGKQFETYKEELSDIDHHAIDSFESKVAQTIQEIKEETERAEKLFEAAKYLKDEEKGAEHKAKMKERYQRSKLAGKLEHGGFGGQFARVVTSMVAAEHGEPMTSIKNESELNLTSLMLFDEGDEFGFQMVGWVKEYQEKSSGNLNAKIQTTLTFLDENEAKSSAAAPVKVLDGSGNLPGDLPNLCQKLGMKSTPMFEDEEGSEPWVVSIRSNHQRVGPGGIPLPGIGCVLQHVGGAAVSFLIVPVKVLVESGLTVLNDVATFANTESGSKAIEKHGWLVTLYDQGKALYVPYSMYPIPIARDPDDDKQPKVGTFWSKPVFNKQLAQATPEGEWIPIVNNNREHLQALSGQKLWKRRLTVFDKLVTERAAQMLGFNDGSSPTVPDDAASLVAAEEAQEAAKQQRLEDKRTEAEKHSVPLKATAKAAATVKASEAASASTA